MSQSCFLSDSDSQSWSYNAQRTTLDDDCLWDNGSLSWLFQQDNRITRQVQFQGYQHSPAQR